MAKYLTKQEIKDTFISLSYSQGLYGRILRDIEETEDPDRVYQELENKHFESTLDLILYIEG